MAVVRLKPLLLRVVLVSSLITKVLATTNNVGWGLNEETDIEEPNVALNTGQNALVSTFPTETTTVVAGETATKPFQNTAVDKKDEIEAGREPKTPGEVEVIDGKYYGIVIEIKDDVKEDDKLIEELQIMLNLSSSVLRELTADKAGTRPLEFGEVTISIPHHWQRQEPTLQVAVQSPSVVVSAPDPQYGHIPYTLQPGGCGEEGLYIHLTPDYVKNMRSILATLKIGAPRRVFIHEWAHYRWGVFDEYVDSPSRRPNDEWPFYLDDDLQIRASACPRNTTGWIARRIDSTASSVMFPLTNVTVQPERINSALGLCLARNNESLPPQDCFFYPDPDQAVVRSLMGYLGGKREIEEMIDRFCGTARVPHDPEAPTLHNFMCAGQSVWEVISSHRDLAPKCSNDSRQEKASHSSVSSKVKFYVRKRFHFTTLAVVLECSAPQLQLISDQLELFQSTVSTPNLVVKIIFVQSDRRPDNYSATQTSVGSSTDLSEKMMPPVDPIHLYTTNSFNESIERNESEAYLGYTLMNSSGSSSYETKYPSSNDVIAECNASSPLVEDALQSLLSENNSLVVAVVAKTDDLVARVSASVRPETSSALRLLSAAGDCTRANDQCLSFDPASMDLSEILTSLLRTLKFESDAIKTASSDRQTSYNIARPMASNLDTIDNRDMKNNGSVRNRRDDNMGGNRRDENMGGNRRDENMGGNRRDENMGGNRRDENMGGNRRDDNMDANRRDDNMDANRKDENMGGNRRDENMGGNRRDENMGGKMNDNKIRVHRTDENMDGSGHKNGRFNARSVLREMVYSKDLIMAPGSTMWSASDVVFLDHCVGHAVLLLQGPPQLHSLHLSLSKPGRNLSLTARPLQRNNSRSKVFQLHCTEELRIST
ncbi:uncharacterized protein LOC108664991 [Hyalella azteca]|uniref:Uncharacterized protein LOC108664991 n=1 Tax=Hyalella azteca TaxID=294128 RepID=A0A8B7N048_HYAAZ|nr:uncharacterized protein LOC108664991 [Hyalella azteca]